MYGLPTDTQRRRMAETAAIQEYRLDQAISQSARQMVALVRARIGADADLAERIIVDQCCVHVEFYNGDSGAWDVVEWRQR